MQIISKKSEVVIARAEAKDGRGEGGVYVCFGVSERPTGRLTTSGCTLLH